MASSAHRWLIAASVWLFVSGALTGCATQEGPVTEAISPLPSATGSPQVPTPAATAAATAEPSAWPGGHILYHADETGIFQIYSVVNGAAPLQLTSGGSAFEPAWSPDGDQIAFAAWTDDTTNIRVYLMQADGSGRHQVTDSQPRLNWRPAWSPDGQQLTFMSNRDGNFEIYRVNGDGSELLNLTQNPKDDRDAVWAPDGSRIAFVSDREGQNDIYLMNPDGSDPVRLTGGPSSDVFPQWSPRGDSLVFSSDRDGAGYGIYMLHIESGEVESVADQTAIDDSTPAWVGDDRIIFSANLDAQWELFLVNVDGTGLVQLTETEASERFPVWRP